MNRNIPPKEGELFLNVTVENYTFELRYGYYEETDRLRGEPVPIYPDLKSNPLYTGDGQPIVTAVQVPCEYYKTPEGFENEDCCSNCIYYPDIKDEIGICQCEKRRSEQSAAHTKSPPGGI